MLAEGCVDKLTKGDKVIVVGTIKESSWEKDGVKQTRMEVVADSIGQDVTNSSISRVTEPAKIDEWSTDPF
jgi:single-stranded DNA-binding protein